MKLVPDASVVVNWFVPERDHAPARDLRDDYLDGRHELLAPALLPFEVTNGLTYSWFRDGERLTVAAESLVEQDLELRPLARVGAAAEIAAELDLTVYDASYISLAAAVDGRAYTADENLLSAVSHTEFADRLAHIADYR